MFTLFCIVPLASLDPRFLTMGERERIRSGLVRILLFYLLRIEINPETVQQLILPGTVEGGAMQGASVGLTVTPGTALVHELGHAFGYSSEGYARFPSIGQTNSTAVRFENAHRRLMARGRPFGRRLGH